MKPVIVKIQNETDNKCKQWPQYLAVLTACLASISCGLAFAWPSPSLPILKAQNGTYHITSEEEAYIVIVNPLGDIIGAPIAASMADIIGRKKGLLLVSIPVIVSWIITAIAETTWMFCLARVLAGIGDGMLFIVLPMYIGEVTEPNVRGVLGCSISISILIGMLITNSAAPYLSIQDTAIIFLFSPLVFVLCFIWMPESPYYLVMKDKLKEAKKALQFLRRNSVDKEFEILISDVKRQMSERGTMKELITIRSNRKALFIMIGLRTVQQLSGISAFSVFTQSIFSQMGNNISPVLATIIYLMTQLAITSFGSVLIEKFGRKIPYIVSCLGTGIILILTGAYFYVEFNTEIDTSNIQVLAIILMLLYIIVYSIGLGTVPTLMLGELFSASIKSKALSFMCIYYAVMITITSKLHHYLNENFGLSVSFLTFGVLCLINTLLSCFFVPETKGKSLEDIQQYLKGNKVEKSKNNNI